MHNPSPDMTKTPELESASSAIPQSRAETLSKQAQQLLQKAIEEVVREHHWASNPNVEEFLFFMDFADGKIPADKIEDVISNIKRAQTFILIAPLVYEGNNEWQAYREKLDKLMQDEKIRVQVQAKVEQLFKA